MRMTWGLLDEAFARAVVDAVVCVGSCGCEAVLGWLGSMLLFKLANIVECNDTPVCQVSSDNCKRRKKKGGDRRPRTKLNETDKHKRGDGDALDDGEPSLAQLARGVVSIDADAVEPLVGALDALADLVCSGALEEGVEVVAAGDDVEAEMEGNGGCVCFDEAAGFDDGTDAGG
jgi:hypothetical protein